MVRRRNVDYHHGEVGFKHTDDIIMHLFNGEYIQWNILRPCKVSNLLKNTYY